MLCFFWGKIMVIKSHLNQNLFNKAFQSPAQKKAPPTVWWGFAINLI